MMGMILPNVFRVGIEMGKHNLLKSAFMASMLATAVAAAPAYALEAKQCGSRSEILTALKNEGQVEIIGGIRAAIGAPRNIFTSNRDGSLGYNVEAGAYDEAGKLCVGAKYTDVRLNSNPGFARPAWASDGRGSPSDLVLDKIERKNNDKVIMGATSLVRDASGNERKGAFILVTRGDPPPGISDTSSGSAYVRTANGLGTLIAMGNVEPTANFYALAKRPVQTAAVSIPTPN